MKRAIVSGGFDDLRFADFRFLDEASKLGALHVQVWSDDVFHAIKGRSETVARLLVERGADVNSPMDSDNMHSGTTPLMFAAGYKSLPIVKLLVEHDANVNARNKAGDTALSIAQKAEMNGDVITYLKEHGAL